MKHLLEFLTNHSQSYERLIHDFFIKYAEGLGFLAGLTAYPIGAALLSILGGK